jgi:hypothetical protein
MGSLIEQPFSNGKPYSHAEVTTSQRWSFLVSTLERPNPSWVLADMASLPTLFLGDAHKDSAEHRSETSAGFGLLATVV